MINVFIQSVYPAPYRVGVFNCLNEYKDINIFVTFEQEQGDKRNSKWFEKKLRFSYCFLKQKKEYREQIKKIKRRKYDIVVAYDYSSISSMVLMIRCILRKIPYCINCDGAFIHHNWLKDKIKTFFIKHATKCLANGKYAKEYFLTYGAKEENICLHKFTNLYQEEILREPISKKEKEKIKKELEIPYKRVYLSIGSYIYRKGYDLLLEAVKNTPKEDVGFVFIGGGEKKQEYEKYITDNHLKSVQLLEFKEKSQILKYYDASDVFIFPTREDIWGLVINEAMGRGLPVIATDMCIAAKELVENEINGRIVQANSIKSLMKAITEFNLLTDKQLEEMGKNSIEKSTEYTIENIAKSHIGVFRKIYEEEKHANSLC